MIECTALLMSARFISKVRKRKGAGSGSGASPAPAFSFPGILQSWQGEEWLPARCPLHNRYVLLVLGDVKHNMISAFIDESFSFTINYYI